MKILLSLFFSIGETLDGINFSGMPREIIIWVMFNVLILYLLHYFSHLGKDGENRIIHDFTKVKIMKF